MPLYRDFEFKLNRDIILKTMDCYENSSIYESVISMYNKLKDELKDIVNPMGVYEKKEKLTITEKNISEPCLCGYYYTFISLGHEISQRNSGYFKQGKYLEGMLLNTMCDHLLFTYSRQMLKYIKELSRVNNSFVVGKIAPGDEISFENVKIIIDTLKTYNKFLYSVEVNKAYIVNPAKSLTSIYMISKENKGEVIHNCKMCSKHCQFGKVLEYES